MKLKKLFENLDGQAVRAEKEERWVVDCDTYEELTAFLKKWTGDEVWKKLLKNNYKEENGVYRMALFGKKFNFRIIDKKDERD